MTFSPLVGDVLRRSRGRIESIMSTTCTVTRPGVRTEDDWNPSTGTYDDPEPVVVYDGPCRLRMPYAYPQRADTGESLWAADRGIIAFPIDGSEDIADGMTVTITDNPNDPAMVGVEMSVLSGHYQTDGTARRIPVQLDSRDVGAEP